MGSAIAWLRRDKRCTASAGYHLEEADIAVLEPRRSRARLRRRLWVGLVFGWAALVPFLSPPSAYPQVTFKTVVDLGAMIPGAMSFPRSINNSGVVVGRAGYDNASNTRAILWTLATRTNLGTLPGGDYSAAFRISDAGQVVGSANTATAVRAFLWTVNDGMRDLGALPGDSSSEAFGINSNAQIVGYSSGPSGMRAVRWSSKGIEALGTLPGGDYSRAFAINDAGQIVGTSLSSQGMRAVLWTPGSQIKNLGTLPGDSASEAFGINAGGQIIGYSRGPNGTRAVRWTPGGRIQDLGTLPGGDYSRALGINDAGQVVGSSSSTAGTRAVLWSPSGAIQDVNLLIPAIVGLVLGEAQAINNLGQIAALSGHAEDPFGGDEHEHFPLAYLLLP